MKKIETVLPSLYDSSIIKRSLRGAAVSPVDQKCTLAEENEEKRRCINKTAVFARAGGVDGLGIALGIDS